MTIFTFRDPSPSLSFTAAVFDPSQIHRAADRHLAAFRDAFLVAVQRWRVSINRDEATDAVERKAQAELEAMLGIGFEPAYRPRYRLVLPRPLRDGWNIARSQLPSLPPKSLSLVPRFDLTNPRVSIWADQHAAEHVREVTDETRLAIRQIVSRALASETNVNPRVLAEQIIGEIGLTQLQAHALDKYRDRLVKDGRKPGDVERLTARYEQAKLKERAMTIARTETITASASGQQLLWQEAAASGYLDAAEWEREWVVTRDDRLCPRCIPMAGERAKLGLPYRIGVMGPALHPRCRCAEKLVRISLN